MALHTHTSRPHKVRNANQVHDAERTSIIDRIADWTTDSVGTAQCAILFLGIGIGSLVGYLINNPLLGIVCGAVSSYILQLVLLAVLQYSNNKSDRRSQILADETFKHVTNAEHHEEQLIIHLGKQDSELIKQTRILIVLLVGQMALLLLSNAPSVGRWVSSRAHASRTRAG